MKKLFAPLLLVSAAAALFAHTASAQELTGTLKKIKDSGVIALGVRESSIPFSYSDNSGKTIGYSQEIALKIVDAVKKDLNMPNLKVTETPITSQNRIALMQNGTIDLECGSTTHTFERAKQVGFSHNIFLYSIKMIAKTGSGITDLNSLKGKTIATTAGTTADRILSGKKGEIGFNLIQTKEHSDGFLTVKQGRAVAFVMDEPLLYGQRAALSADEAKGYEIVGPNLQFENYACMTRMNDAPFTKVVNTVIADMEKSGEMTKLYDKWFTQPVPPKGQNMNYPMTAEMRAMFKDPITKAYD
ncbi:transporter substrate-binding domain-containing protein [Pandoraea sputorum]|uniref:transporter substrate-binding domain-containing protein n=1 Tax=Pandoraea sputorum TaxID=93222 RepID=UPI001E3AB74D|nr:transporter substrate-binding domain-containing protein [Pandoraea sputorum]MCE4060438.1 transporter substrate-binding domain-containing protein [Pandoraea sputorum]